MSDMRTKLEDERDSLKISLVRNEKDLKALKVA